MYCNTKCPKLILKAMYIMIAIRDYKTGTKELREEDQVRRIKSIFTSDVVYYTTIITKIMNLFKFGSTIKTCLYPACSLLNTSLPESGQGD